jgi:hypothetical protein
MGPQSWRKEWMHELPSTFEKERALALDRLKPVQPRMLLFLVGLVATGVVLALLADGIVVRAFAVLVPAAVALTGWRKVSSRGHALRKTIIDAREAELWFASADTGLVFFDERGIFFERGQRFFPYEPTHERKRDMEGNSYTVETRLASISYEENGHAMKLQLVRHGVENRSSESHEAVQFSLPQSVAADRALQVAIEANRKAARAS